LWSASQSSKTEIATKYFDWPINKKIKIKIKKSENFEQHSPNVR
jgi:hypothetical protein